MSQTSSSLAESTPTGWRRWMYLAMIGTVTLGLNILAYIFLTPDRIEHLGVWSYFGAFSVAALANATVVVPVPYLPIIVRLGQTFDVWGIIVVAAAGSAIGESVAFFVGRSGQRVVKHTRFYAWVQRQMHRPWRAAVALFLLAAPLNPAFDVAGLIAGATGISFWLFLVMVFLGRIVRMWLAVLIGFGIESV